MARFEEVQMIILESATKYLELQQMQVLTEQFTLDRESNIILTLPIAETHQLITSEVSYIFDAFQTGFSLLSEDIDEEKEVDTTIDIDFTIKFPVIKDYPDLTTLYEDLTTMLEDVEPTLIIKEHIDIEGSIKLYELVYSYEIDFVEDMDSELFDELFHELKEVMNYIYEKTEPYIDYSWYSDND